MSMSDMPIAAGIRPPTVYFIDDSATMREVIKIAFRKENIQVVTCPDAASAISQFEENRPDAVITDVIMPDKDGYEVCQLVKQNAQLAKTPVILMSGVVNRAVAERAMAVGADELIRKPFQPPDLIGRVKKLLNPQQVPVTRVADLEVDAPLSARPNPLQSLFTPGAGASPGKLPGPQCSAGSVAVESQSNSGSAVLMAGPAPKPSSSEPQKLRSEVHRLELLVKKLQAELEAQRQYCIALEAHLKTLQEAE
jgi:CheY-like chemotaxis protein